MSHEKLNDPFQWKNKLDDLDHLPGEPLTGKTEAWEKLQARLQDKPRKKMILSYWTVAASLLLIAGVAWFLVDEKGTGLPQVQVQQTEGNIITESTLVIGKEDTVTVVSNVRVDSKPATTVKREKKKVHVSLGKSPVIEKRISTNEEIVKVSSPGIPGNNMDQTDTAAAITAIPAKKKLRVVHINELQKPATPDIYSNSLAHDNSYSGILISKNASDNLIKIKLTPSN